jgi:hypothetical protein
MTIRHLLVAVLLVPAVVDAQRIIIPTRAPRPPIEPPHPTAEGPGAREIAYRRSRWSTEAYTLVHALRMPTEAGLITYTTLGSGTHADYRAARRFSASLDMSTSLIGDPAITRTVEVGTRFRPTASAYRVNPYFDARLGYAENRNTYALFDLAGAAQSLGGGTPVSVASRGVGAIGGLGMEIAVTSRWSVNTGLSAMRSRLRLTQYSVSSRRPDAEALWSTSYRMIFGLRYNNVRYSRLSQNPAR